MADENTSTQNTSGSGFSQSPFGRLGDAVGTENLPGFPGGGGTESGGEGGNSFAGGGSPVSPFDQIRYNIDQAIYTAFPPGGGTPDANTSIDTSTLNPFNQPPGGGSQSGGGNQFGGGTQTGDGTQTSSGEDPSFGGYNPFDPGFGGNVSNQAIQASSGSEGGSTGGFGGGSTGGSEGGSTGGSEGDSTGGFGGGSTGGFGGGSTGGFGGDSTGGFGGGSTGGFGGGSTGGFGGGSTGGFGGGSTGGFGGGDSNQADSPFASNPQANQIDATRADLSNFVTTQVNGGDTGLIEEQIASTVSGLVTSLTGSTPSLTVEETVEDEPVLVSEVVTPAEDNIVIPTGEVIVVSNTTNQSDIINSGIDTSSVATLNESVAGSSVTSNYPTQEEFLAILNGGDLNLPDYLSDDAKAYIQGQVSTIGGNIGQYQETFASGNSSTDGSNPFSGADTTFGGGTNLFI
ncbi:hypothetical protein NUACC26_062300 [Scytonema sp. NUACC26]